MISALTPSDRALALRSDGRNIDAQQMPTNRRGAFERTFKGTDGAREARAKTPKEDTSPDQASEIVAGSARLIDDKSAKQDTAERRLGRASKGSGGTARRAGFSVGTAASVQKADIAMSKSEVAPAKQGQAAFNAVGAHELSATQKKTKLVAKSTPGAALVATGGEQNAKKPSVAKSELEKLGSKKKAATKSRKPAKTGAVSDPKRAVIGDFVKVAAERKIKHALDQDKSLSGGALGVSDPKFTTSTTIGPVARVDGGQAVARAVAVQISQAVANGANKMVEISLDPVELGKVKMKLRPSDSGITVQIIADRADTIDLMRRNTAMLEAEFRDVGYDNINFTFAQNNNGSHAHADDDPPPIESLGEGRSAATGSSVTSPVSSARTITRLGLGDGLDIRL